jgi:lipid-binding SYLF domain-containing protein
MVRSIRYVAAIGVVLGMATLGAQNKEQNKEQERLGECGEVMEEILNVPENIPQDLLDKAECVVVIPSMKKFALGIGGSYGRGAMVCRTGQGFKGAWSAPAMYTIEGASVGFQIGGQATDLVLLVMNRKGVNALLGSKVKLGGNASVAAGPKGRTAEASTDASMRAEILTYSRSAGLFAGVSLSGSSLRAQGHGEGHPHRTGRAGSGVGPSPRERAADAVSAQPVGGDGPAVTTRHPDESVLPWTLAILSIGTRRRSRHPADACASHGVSAGSGGWPRS